MSDLDEGRDWLLAPDDAYAPVLAHHPVYIEMGSGKIVERWHAVSTLCPQCGQRLVEATTPQGERLVLMVSARTWRIRLTEKKDDDIAERAGGSPEHGCP